ncbi:activating transcription factor 7-interacting protein 2 isoform X2 [Monodelphis domestica]|uniref:activating transcription factor 7-interacting protein 2 isoform X2 n=1 Tax=Monodelphis domestica TaxID=13616 RepID=UPI0004434669|nr:activating transcription factor 7-interacting protein 2 isoform X2 [Monodelphis domestica]
MASSGPPAQKILKAKKTMPTSFQKQIHMHKSGNIETLKAIDRNNVHSGNQQLRMDVIHKKSENSDMKNFLLDSRRNTILPQENETFPQTLALSLKAVKSNSEMNFVNEQVIDPTTRPSETEDSCKKLFIQDSSDLQKTSCGSEHKANEKKISFEQAKVDLNPKPSSSPSILLNGLINKPAYILGSHIEKTFNGIWNGKGNHVRPRLEVTSHLDSPVSQQNEAISVIHSNIHLKANKTSNLKRPVEVRKDTSDFLKTQEYNQINCSSRIDYGNTVSTWHSSFETNNNTSKKRALSGNKENIKRMKTSNEINENICIVVEEENSLFEQVKCLIRQEVCIVNYKIFDSKLKELNERVDKTQCRKKHEAIAIQLLRKISRLDRRIKAALAAVQKNGLELKTPTQNMAYKVTNSKTILLNKNQGAERDRPNIKLASLNNKSSGSSEIPIPEAKQKKNLTSDCVEVVSESNNADVMMISEENVRLKAPVTDVEKTVLAKSNDSLGSKTKFKASGGKIKLDDLVIDLTEEANLNCKTASLVQVLELPVAANENLKEKKQPIQDSAQVLESFEHLPSLPDIPQHPVLAGFNDSLPPQKFELKLKQVLKPKGIALTWNISQINPRCAPVESYHLFICHENTTSNSKTAWKKIGEIKALPLPMACTLSQFVSSSTYYFTLQAKDIYGRYGPFCDIKYTHGFSEDTKESQILPT